MVLYSFEGGADGSQPEAGMIFDPSGNLYGTVIYSDAFELSRSDGGRWTETVLHSFNGGDDGLNPVGNLVRDAAGNLYGTTEHGGVSRSSGTVFELSPTQGGGWTETVLHNFSLDGLDGITPLAGMVFDAAGNLYGTTNEGGKFEYGTVFKLSPNGSGGWTETILHSFGSGTDGQGPLAGLVFDAAGNLFGTTRLGGIYGFGTVFELTPNGSGKWTERVVHNFGDSTDDGLLPEYGSLAFDADGNLFGTTDAGGNHKNDGAVFELKPDGNGGWSESVIYNFNRDSGGYQPYSGVTLDAAGNLYGTTAYGGTYGLGTVFELTRVDPCLRCAHAGIAK